MPPTNLIVDVAATWNKVAYGTLWNYSIWNSEMRLGAKGRIDCTVAISSVGILWDYACISTIFYIRYHTMI